MHTGESLAGAPGGRLADRQFRLLALAALGSLALHALLLYVLPILKETARAPAPPLVARLAELKPKPQPPEPPKVEPPPPRPALPPPPRPAPSAKPAPQLPAPAPQSVAPVLSAEPTKPVAETAPPVPAAPQTVVRSESAAAPSAAPAPPTAPAPAPSGPDPGSVARYRIELMEMANRYKRYPRVAQDNNWEGRVELRVAVAESGALASITLKKSSGRAVLDEEAQAMIRGAHPRVGVPPVLRGKGFVLEIAVDFSLKDAR